MEKEYIYKAKKAIKHGSSKSERPLLIVLMGLPGTGKSYLANYLHRKYSFTVLSGESITYAIFGTEKCSGAQYKKAYEILRYLAKELLENKHDFVIDGTNLKYEFRKQIYDAVNDLARVILIYLSIDDEIALERTNIRTEDFSNSKQIISKCPPETFASFKAQLEHPREDEKFYKVKSDDNLFKEIDKIITN